jgi:hypothetical protein
LRRALGAALVLTLSGCAVFEADNRRTLNALDAHASPPNAAARWALAPVALPVSFVAALADVVIVHPVCSIDDAWHDTVDWLWTPHGESKFRRAVLLPLSALATPFVFTGDLAARAVFAIPPHGEEAP